MLPVAKRSPQVEDGRMEAAPTIPEWTLGDRLRKAREAAGYKQSDLSDVIDISPRTLGKYERDEQAPKRHVVIAWAMACGVPMTWITQGGGGPEGPTDQGITRSGCFADRHLRAA
jgi:transcriptional regulator with XRE-family HTH domain